LTQHGQILEVRIDFAMHALKFVAPFFKKSYTISDSESTEGTLTVLLRSVTVVSSIFCGTQERSQRSQRTHKQCTELQTSALQHSVLARTQHDLRIDFCINSIT
jgi:hypothetical protein